MQPRKTPYTHRSEIHLQKLCKPCISNRTQHRSFLFHFSLPIYKTIEGKRKADGKGVITRIIIVTQPWAKHRDGRLGIGDVPDLVLLT